MVWLVSLLVPALPVVAQSDRHAEAEVALEHIVFHHQFAGLELAHREIITFTENPKVKGMNGLLLMRWRGESASVEVTASVQWFEKTADLLDFYRGSQRPKILGLKSIDKRVVWKTENAGYFWTDSEHFVVGLIGSPPPSEELLKAWLSLVASRLPELAAVPLPSS